MIKGGVSRATYTLSNCCCDAKLKSKVVSCSWRRAPDVNKLRNTHDNTRTIAECLQNRVVTPYVTDHKALARCII